MKRFYLTTETMCDGECYIADYIGNIRGARTYAKKYANDLNEVVYINDCSTDDIVDSVFPDFDDYFYDFGTDLQFGKHDLEVMNGEGYYDDEGFYYAYAKEC